MLVDSHCHLNMLDLAEFANKIDNVVQNAVDHGVTHMLNVGTELTSFPQVLQTAKQYPNVYASLGIHPNEELTNEPDTDELIKLASDPKVIAIGETGLDYYRTSGDVSWQQNRFRQHIQVAHALGKPLIVHTRQARQDTLNILREEQAEKVGGVLHCFTEDWAMAKEALDFGFYISFSGIITFKNAEELRDVVKHVPLEKMLIETDSPYLAPIPYRGKQNQPAYVRYVAEHIAQLKGVSYEEVANTTAKNFFELFSSATI